MTTPRWTLAPRATLGLVLASALLIAVGAVALAQLQGLRQANARVGRTFEVLNTIESVTRRLVDAETAQRGFLLTARPNYLEPLTQAHDALPAELDRLAELLPDNAAQHANLEALRPLVDAKLAELAETIRLRETQGLEASLAVVDAGGGNG